MRKKTRHAVAGRCLVNDNSVYLCSREREQFGNRGTRTFPVEPVTLNSSRSSSPLRFLSTMKNLGRMLMIRSTTNVGGLRYL